MSSAVIGTFPVSAFMIDTRMGTCNFEAYSSNSICMKCQEHFTSNVALIHAPSYAPLQYRMLNSVERQTADDFDSIVR